MIPQPSRPDPSMTEKVPKNNDVISSERPLVRSLLRIWRSRGHRDSETRSDAYWEGYVDGYLERVDDERGDSVISCHSEHNRYGCERGGGHSGPHWALNGKVIWEEPAT